MSQKFSGLKDLTFSKHKNALQQRLNFIACGISTWKFLQLTILGLADTFLRKCPQLIIHETVRRNVTKLRTHRLPLTNQSENLNARKFNGTKKNLEYNLYFPRYCYSYKFFISLCHS